MRNSKDKFDKSELQLPFDNTWTVTDTLEINNKGDTTWIKRAEKLFKNVSDINQAYQNDTSINGKLSRNAGFTKKFRWFNTEYRFYESVDKVILSGHPLSEFFNREELTYYFSPDYIKFNKENGADSIKYKILSDSIKKKEDAWILKNITALWIDEFIRLIGPNAGAELSFEALKSKESEFTEVLMENEAQFDSLWTKGILLTKFIGEANATKYKTEADSAVEIAVTKIIVDFKDYSMRMVMPGRLIATNGYVDSTKNLLWPVKSDFYLTDKYEMWAESKTTNLWAWFVSGLFLVFVCAGIMIRKK
jgi:hypothetical protein